MGLTRIYFDKDINTFKSTTIDDRHGLFGVEVSDISIIEDTIWIGTSKGLYFVNASFFYKKEINHSISLMFKKLLVNDQPVKIEDEISLTYDKNRLLFSFSAISLENADKLQYRYKLVGAEERWNYTKRRSAIYSNLAPRIYEFIVQVQFNDKSWSEEIKMQISITPPLWQTWWFKSGVILVLGLIIFLFFKMRIFLYNRDILRELLRQILKRIKIKEKYFIVKEGRNEVKIYTSNIFYVKSDGNYLEIHQSKAMVTIRCKMSDFLMLVPDPTEFIQIRRSYIIRIDKIEEKSKKYVRINNEIINVGSTYLENFEKLISNFSIYRVIQNIVHHIYNASSSH